MSRLSYSALGVALALALWVPAIVVGVDDDAEIADFVSAPTIKIGDEIAGDTKAALAPGEIFGGEYYRVPVVRRGDRLHFWADDDELDNVFCLSPDHFDPTTHALGGPYCSGPRALFGMDGPSTMVVSGGEPRWRWSVLAVANHGFPGPYRLKLVAIERRRVVILAERPRVSPDGALGARVVLGDGITPVLGRRQRAVLRLRTPAVGEWQAAAAQVRRGRVVFQLPHAYDLPGGPVEGRVVVPARSGLLPASSPWRTIALQS